MGGTDQHIGPTAIEENNFFGVTPQSEPKAGRALGVFSHLGDVKVMNREMGWPATARSGLSRHLN